MPTGAGVGVCGWSGFMMPPQDDGGVGQERVALCAPPKARFPPLVGHISLKSMPLGPICVPYSVPTAPISPPAIGSATSAGFSKGRRAPRRLPSAVPCVLAPSAPPPSLSAILPSHLCPRTPRCCCPPRTHRRALSARPGRGEAQEGDRGGRRNSPGCSDGQMASTGSAFFRVL